jgi:hypothetical protein
MSIVDKQSRLNRSTGGQWNLYASHRQELERLLVPSRPGGRICVLGAGNCNDLDLRWLTQVYREVHLVDIDGDALARAAKFQKVEGSEKLRLHGSIDLTGLADRLGTWAKAPPTSAEIEICTRLAAQPPDKLAAEPGGRAGTRTLDVAGPALRTVSSGVQGTVRSADLARIGHGYSGSPFDAVLSPCVLSQLLTPLRDTIGEAHPGFPPLFAAMRARHFRLMLDLLAPGGRGVFACDLFSSVVLPDLARATKDQLPNLMRKMIARERVFSGLDPTSIAAVLMRDPLLCPLTAKVQPVAPWLWHLGLSKTYLVYAVTFMKTGAGPIGEGPLCDESFLLPLPCTQGRGLG